MYIFRKALFVARELDTRALQWWIFCMSSFLQWWIFCMPSFEQQALIFVFIRMRKVTGVITYMNYTQIKPYILLVCWQIEIAENITLLSFVVKCTSPCQKYPPQPLRLSLGHHILLDPPKHHTKHHNNYDTSCGSKDIKQSIFGAAI